jgi:hypothetical protein
MRRATEEMPRRSVIGAGLGHYHVAWEAVLSFVFRVAAIR